MALSMHIPRKPNLAKWNWQTRARAWIFGMGEELLLGVPADGTTHSGEAYRVHRVVPAGEEHGQGESDKVSRLADACVEFHVTMEMTLRDLDTTVAADPRRGCPRLSFWIEPVSDSGTDNWRVVYVGRRGVPVVDLLCLRDRLAKPSRAKLMVAIKSARMKVMAEDIGL